jgi:outer membrane protein assembly factor BamB
MRLRCELCLLAAFACLVSARTATGQVTEAEIPAEGVEIVTPTNPNNAEADGGLHGSLALSENAAVRRRFEQAIRLQDNGRLSDAALAFGGLAEAIDGADVFVRSGKSNETFIGLQAALQDRIAALPPEARAAYELAFGVPARKMLDESAGEMTTLRRIARLYLHTEAGADALYRLAVMSRDRGAFSEAASYLRRLRSLGKDRTARFQPNLSLQLANCERLAGHPDQAQRVLADLERETPQATAVLGGIERPLFREGERSGDGHSEILIGNDLVDVTSVHEGSGEPFAVPRWSREISVTQSSTAGLDRRILPPVTPNFIGNLALVPTGRGFIACDLASGRTVWKYPADGTDALSWEALRRDSSSRKLSTDGRRVYVIDPEASNAAAPAVAIADPFNAINAVQQQAAFFAPAFGVDIASQAAARSNVLSALDVAPPRQANLAWQVGGDTGLAEPALAGHFFLGSPLVAEGRLYAIADNAGEIRLVVLNAATGRLEWSLRLGTADHSFGGERQRTHSGMTPILHRDILLCPTGAGAVVAVDCVQRCLRWGFRYPVIELNDDPFSEAPAASSVSRERAWLDDALTLIGDERVFVAPPESDRLYCLAVATGDVLWKQERAEGGFIATAQQGHVLIIGPSGAKALSVEDGTPAGPPLPFPESSVPTGRGYTVLGSYIQPLSDGSHVRMDLAAKSIAIAKRPTGGIVDGSLAWHNRAMLSIGPEFMRLYDDRASLLAQVEGRLAANPEDSEALARRADLASAAGRYAEAIADARAAYRLAPSEAASNRLVAALLDGIRKGLPKAAQYDEELDRLADEALRRAR